jgi:hypothetical protein
LFETCLAGVLPSLSWSQLSVSVWLSGRTDVREDAPVPPPPLLLLNQT